jgi:hypothetical protein
MKRIRNSAVFLGIAALMLAIFSLASCNNPANEPDPVVLAGTVTIYKMGDANKTSLSTIQYAADTMLVANTSALNVTDSDSLEFHWLKGGQMIEGSSTTSGMYTLVEGDKSNTITVRVEGKNGVTGSVTSGEVSVTAE